jgi:hypothetical protein
MFQIGFYATDPDIGEILYRISQFDNPNYVPAASERGWTFAPTFTFATGNASEVTFTIDPSGLATRSEVDGLINQVDQLAAKLSALTGLTVADIVPTYAALTAIDPTTLPVGTLYLVQADESRDNAANIYEVVEESGVNIWLFFSAFAVGGAIMKNATIPVSGWVAGEPDASGAYWYENTINDSDIADTDVIIMLATDEESAALIAEYMRGYIDTAEGVITVYAVAIPDNDINVNYTIYEGVE